MRGAREARNRNVLRKQAFSANFEHGGILMNISFSFDRKGEGFLMIFAEGGVPYFLNDESPLVARIFTGGSMTGIDPDPRIRIRIKNSFGSGSGSNIFPKVRKVKIYNQNHC